MRFLTCLTQDHNLWLVGLAALFCLVGSAITIQLLGRIRQAEPRTRLAWIFMGGVSTGATIWCTHFIAMIAYQPGVRVSYEPRLTGVSLLFAIAGSAIALKAATMKGRWMPACGGALFGLAVTIMHYTGMRAFAAQASSAGRLTMSRFRSWASFCSAAAAFDRALAHGRFAGGWFATGLMVGSIVVLHFTGMAAMAIVPFAAEAGQAGSDDAAIIMAFAVAGVGMLVLGTGLSTYVLDAQASAESKRRLDEVLEGNVDGMVVTSAGASWPPTRPSRRWQASRPPTSWASRSSAGSPAPRQSTPTG